MDGRDFIKQIVKADIVRHLEDDKLLMVIMNLPALAIEFLDSFVGLLRGVSVPMGNKHSPVQVHCYCFSKGMK